MQTQSIPLSRGEGGPNTPTNLTGYTVRADGRLEKTFHADGETLTLVRSPRGCSLWVESRTGAATEMTTATSIIRFICDRYQVTPKQLESPSRSRHIVWPRWIAITLIRLHTRLTIPHIAILFNRHHTSVLVAEAGVARECETTPARAAEVADVKSTFLLHLHSL